MWFLCIIIYVTCVTQMYCGAYCLDLPSIIFNCTIIIAESSGKFSMRLKRRPKFATDHDSETKETSSCTGQRSENTSPLKKESASTLLLFVCFLLGFLSLYFLSSKEWKNSQSIQASRAHFRPILRDLKNSIFVHELFLCSGRR
jgi:hypothetical protein